MKNDSDAILHVYFIQNDKNSQLALLIHTLFLTHSILFCITTIPFCPFSGKNTERLLSLGLPAAVSCQNKPAAVMSTINMMDGICNVADLTTRTGGDRSTGSPQIYNTQQEILP